MVRINQVIKTVGNEVYIINDNKIIGNGKVAGKYGDSFAYVKLSDQLIDKLAFIEDDCVVKDYIRFRFECQDGRYIGPTVIGADANFSLLENSKVVDKHEFVYGYAKGFESVEGYGDGLSINTCGGFEK